jgi:hypothetical protein
LPGDDAKSRSEKSFTTLRRRDSKTFQLTITLASGLLDKMPGMATKSFQNLPTELSKYWNPRTKAVAEVAPW